jgi:hypothetical protein
MSRLFNCLNYFRCDINPLAFPVGYFLEHASGHKFVHLQLCRPVRHLQPLGRTSHRDCGNTKRLSEEDLILEPLDEEAVDVDELDPDDLAANMEKGIRDLPVWQDLVARVGLKEARQILRRGLIVHRITDGNPKN